MNANKLRLICCAVGGMLAFGMLTGCKSSEKSTETGATATSAATEMGATASSPATTKGSDSSAKTQKAQFLFVQTAKDVSFQNGTMVLRGVNPTTICFADRPERIAGHMPTANIVPLWTEGKDSFTADPPNATLSVMNGDAVSNLVVVLRNPRLSGDELTYDIRTLEGTPPAQGGPCSLFIDIIGMPMTPRSYAGAARRADRGAYGYPGAYGPAVVVAPRAVVY
jgi:hypothetical protein